MNIFWSLFKLSVAALASHSTDYKMKALLMPTVTEQYTGVITRMSKGMF
jgi:hypothetical protein